MNKLYILFLLFLVSCDSNLGEYSNIENNEKSDIRIEKLDFDSIMISGKDISMTGEWSIFNDKFWFLDRYMPQIIQFDMDGKYERIIIRTGKGPNEMSTAGILTLKQLNKEYLYIDTNFRLNVIDSTNTFVTKRKSIFNFSAMTSELFKELMSNPDPNNPAIYDYEFDSPTFLRLKDSCLLIPIETEHRDFNAFDGSISNFWTDALTFGVYNIKIGKIEKLFGNYPPYFYDKRIPYLNAPLFDMNEKDEIVVSFQPDPIIYVRDINGKLLRSFGVAAKSIANEKYPEYLSLNESENNRNRNLNTLGYYTSLMIFDGYVFRTFQNNDMKGGGIQIYENDILIGEIALSDAARLIGRDKNGYIWMETKADEEKETIKFYKFKL